MKCAIIVSMLMISVYVLHLSFSPPALAQDAPKQCGSSSDQKSDWSVLAGKNSFPGLDQSAISIGFSVTGCDDTAKAFTGEEGRWILQAAATAIGANSKTSWSIIGEAGYQFVAFRFDDARVVGTFTPGILLGYEAFAGTDDRLVAGVSALMQISHNMSVIKTTGKNGKDIWKPGTSLTFSAKPSIQTRRLISDTAIFDRATDDTFSNYAAMSLDTPIDIVAGERHRMNISVANETVFLPGSDLNVNSLSVGVRRVEGDDDAHTWSASVTYKEGSNGYSGIFATFSMPTNPIE